VNDYHSNQIDSRPDVANAAAIEAVPFLVPRVALADRPIRTD
jgi:hypothetical protein